VPVIIKGEEEYEVEKIKRSSEGKISN